MLWAHVVGPWELLAQVSFPCELETIEENLEELYDEIFHEECFAENHAANREAIDAENVFFKLSNCLKAKLKVRSEASRQKSQSRFPL